MQQPASRRAVMPTMDQTVCTGPSLDAEYDLTTSCLGKGAFSKVYVVIHRGTGEKRAVKRIEKRLMGTSTKGSRAIDLSPVETEIALQKECCVNTDNIVKIFDVFDSGNTVDIVLESMLKDDLFDAIENVYYPEEGEIQHHECRYTELEASKIARQLISAVNACHEHNVCHRDLKPENILVHEYHPLCPVVKLCDFGLAARCAEGDQLTDACGTPEYVAPEVIAKLGYDLSADVWSIGVIVFILLCGEQPFHSNLEGQAATTEVLEQVSSFTSIEDKCTVGDWAIISDDAKSLLQNHLLVRDPSKRMTAHDLLEHQWVCGQAAPTKAIPSALALHHKRWLRRKFRVAIYTLVATNRIRSLVRSLKVAKLDSEGSFSLGQGGALDAVSTYEKLLREFVENDQDGTSMLDSNTFVRVLKSNSVGVGKETEHFTIFADAFTGGSTKRANYRDYCIGLMWRWHGPMDEKLKYMFKVFDLDANDRIDQDEFILMMNAFYVAGKNKRVELKRSQELFVEIDTNKDGQIDLSEFVTWGETSQHLQEYTGHMQQQFESTTKTPSAAAPVANLPEKAREEPAETQQLLVSTAAPASGCCTVM